MIRKTEARKEKRDPERADEENEAAESVTEKRRDAAKEKRKNTERAENNYTDRMEATGHRSNKSKKVTLID